MDTEIIKQLAAQFGFDAALVATFVTIIIFLTNAIKDIVHLAKSGILITILLLSAIMNCAVYLSAGNWKGAVFATIITFALSIGGWSTAKRLAHKVGK